jgi:hypothetical protein
VSRRARRQAIREWNEAIEMLSGLTPELVFVRCDEYLRGGLPASSLRGRGGLGAPTVSDRYDKVFERMERDELADIRRLLVIAQAMQRRENRMLLPRHRNEGDE